MANLEISRAERLDQRVTTMLPEISRSFGTKLITDGRVKVNDVVQTKAGYKLREGDKIDIDFNMETHIQVPEIELPVLYEDDDCVVVVKPVGLLVHSKGDYNPEATVETWLRKRTKLTGARAGIVHRLDRATSGVMICAKTPESLSWLQKQFAQRRTKKTYYAVVGGHLKQPAALIDMPIERNPKAPATFRVGANGKAAKTVYKVIGENDHYTLLELKPETGRTHQLRVHLRQLGHPIVGDTMYDGPPGERLMLHAYQLELTLPNRQREVFTADVPPEFKEMISDTSA